MYFILTALLFIVVWIFLGGYFLNSTNVNSATKLAQFEALQNRFKSIIQDYLLYLEDTRDATGDNLGNKKVELVNLISNWKTTQGALSTRTLTPEEYEVLRDHIISQAIEVLELSKNKEFFPKFFNQYAPFYWQYKVTNDHAPLSLTRILHNEGMLRYQN